MRKVSILSLVLGAALITDSLCAKPAEEVIVEETAEEAKDAGEKTAPPPLIVPTTPAVSRPPPPPAPPAPASDYKYTKPFDVLKSKDGKSLHLVGDITGGSALKLKQAVEKNPDAETVVLSSNGGMVIEGLALGNVIAKNALNTHVETVCASACTLAFLKGNTRSITAFAVMGFHQASRGRPYLRPEKAGDSAGNKVMINAYQAGGASRYIIDNALKTPPQRMWFVGGKEIAQNVQGVQLSKVGQVSYPKGIWWSADDLRSKLYDEPVWKSLAEKRPEYFYPVFAAIWNNGILRKDMDDALEHGRSELKKRLLRDAVTYPDDIILTLIALESQFWEGFKEKRNRNCERIGARRVPFAVQVNADLIARELAVVREIIKMPQPVGAPSEEAMNEAAARVMEFWGMMVAETKMNSYSVKSNFCSQPKVFYEKLQELPKAQQADIFRSLFTPEYRGFPIY